MLGTLTLEGVCQKDLTLVSSTLTKVKAITEDELAILNIADVTEAVAEMESSLAVLQKCMELEKAFNVVKRDGSVLRPVKDTKGGIHMIPLVFWTKLPAPMNTVLSTKDHKFSSRTPSPTPDAMVAMREHGDKFDHLQLWWVPKDITVEEIPKPDPLLVGAIDIPRLGLRYFELCRWIDESVEDGWWTGEGY